MFQKVRSFREPIQKSRKYFIWYFFLSAVSVGFNIYLLLVNRQLLDALTERHPLEEIVWLLGVYSFLVFILLALEYVTGKLDAIFTEKMKHGGKKSLLDRIRKSDATKFKGMDAAYLAQRMDSDFTQILMYYTKKFVPAIVRALHIVIAIYISFTVNVVVATFFILFMPIAYFVYKGYSKKIYDKTDTYRNATSEYFNDFHGQLEHMDEIVQSGSYEKEIAYYDNSFLRYFKRFMDFTKLSLNFNLLISGLGMGIQVIVIIYSAYVVYQGHMTIGDLILLTNFTGSIMKGTLEFANLGKEKKQCDASVDKMNEYYDMEQIQEGEWIVPKINQLSTDITYAYNADKKLYDHLKLEFQTGNIYGILGDNGTGKSTLYKVLTGVIKTNEHSDVKIQMDGKPMEEIDTIAFRKDHVYVVNQSPRTYLKRVEDYFEKNVGIPGLENVLQTLEAKGMATEEVIRPFLEPNWEKAIKDLSGGDRQFLFIIGSLISGKSVRIYDEPTANLDKKRKTWYLDAIQKSKKDAIIILITHDMECQETFDTTYTIGK
ncbi:MAG: ABC transporter ATP-binding protein [Tissierellia bacterium]|nr:ABC transporter ATP-binding protein [Tissierellia bacterium]